jgi:hypothetical protein
MSAVDENHARFTQLARLGRAGVGRRYLDDRLRLCRRLAAAAGRTTWHRLDQIVTFLRHPSSQIVQRIGSSPSWEYYRDAGHDGLHG